MSFLLEGDSESISVTPKYLSHNLSPDPSLPQDPTLKRGSPGVTEVDSVILHPPVPGGVGTETFSVGTKIPPSTSPVQEIESTRASQREGNRSSTQTIV